MNKFPLLEKYWFVKQELDGSLDTYCCRETTRQMSKFATACESLLELHQMIRISQSLHITTKLLPCNSFLWDGIHIDLAYLFHEFIE